ncbi:hypothetical protein BBJ28_00005631 [Nothophytophthora sp. Chile5]|nr:hypothetical protein BBJ28_00005631 [Nothophytophthora sp. Chile5]
MEARMKPEEEAAGPSTPPLDEYDLLQDAMTFFDACDPLPHTSDVVEAAPDLSTPSYSQLNPPCSSSYVLENVEPGGLSLEETAELLHALDATTFFHPLEQAEPAVMEPPSVEVAPHPLAKPGRKKQTQSGTGKMRNPSRERLQNELAYLRKKVVELEGELGTLQHRGRGSPIRMSSGNSGQELIPHGDPPANARVWKRIADRQAEGRERSETENRRLKGVLEGQILLARRLEQLLRKRPNVAVLSEGGNASPQKRLQVINEDPTNMYELFLSELDGLYAQMDGVFHQNGLESSVDDSHRHAYVKTRRGDDGQDVLYAELQDVNLIPFELERASAAMWRSVKRQYGKNRYHSYQNVVERPDDTIAVKYRTKCQRNGRDIWLDAILVMRRYVERDRLACVWRAVSRGDDELSGMYTDETGWSVLKRIPPDSGLTLTGSVMHNCVHVVPKRADRAGISATQHEIGLLTNLVIDSYEDDVIALSAMMEDLLLQDSMASSDLTALEIWSC